MADGRVLLSLQLSHVSEYVNIFSESKQNPLLNGNSSDLDNNNEEEEEEEEIWLLNNEESHFQAKAYFHTVYSASYTKHYGFLYVQKSQSQNLR